MTENRTSWNMRKSAAGMRKAGPCETWLKEVSAYCFFQHPDVGPNSTLTIHIASYFVSVILPIDNQVLVSIVRGIATSFSKRNPLPVSSFALNWHFSPESHESEIISCSEPLPNGSPV